jgi:coenzyme F420-reducing hydrogenase alpha subunit
MTHGAGASRTLKVDALARVEGEGAMTVRVRKGRVADVQLRIYEPPRFFEAFLRGRAYTEPPDITARICGICPVAYQMSACRAIEDACGVDVDGPLRELRRLLYWGEWMESHALHVYFLHAPDFLGYQSAVELARDQRDVVERGLQLKKAGNEIMRVIGGRAIHPINVRVGGFHRVPTRRELVPLEERLRWAREAALATVSWVSEFDFPDYEQQYELMALRHPSEYPVLDGRIVSTTGLDIEAREFSNHVREEQVPHSTALHARLDDRTYLVGPLARYCLNAERLAPVARDAASDASLDPAHHNPFRNIVVRAVEILHACDEALRIIAAYEPPDRPHVAVEPRAATGHGATEAPRGLLYHRYQLSEDGMIGEARIVPPTSQNQAQIEDDLRGFVQARLDLPTPELTRQCEQAIRNYDPCISCATHFLDLRIESD